MRSGIMSITGGKHQFVALLQRFFDLTALNKSDLGL